MKKGKSRSRFEELLDQYIETHEEIADEKKKHKDRLDNINSRLRTKGNEITKVVNENSGLVNDHHHGRDRWSTKQMIHKRGVRYYVIKLSTSNQVQSVSPCIMATEL